MADQSTQSITISANPDAIMAVIADFPSYPDWAQSVKDIEVLSRDDRDRGEQVRFVLDAGVVKDEYVLGYTWGADGLSVSWDLVHGKMQRSQRGSYGLTPQGANTEVTYTLAVELTIPMIGMFKRKAEKVIMDTALKELKRRVES